MDDVTLMVEAGRSVETPAGTVPAASDPAAIGRRQLIGEILVEREAVPQDKVDEAVRAQIEKGGRLGEILVAMKAATEEQVARALAVQLGIDYMPNIAGKEIDGVLLASIPITFLKQQRVVPVRDSGMEVLVAIADPLNTGALDDLRMFYRKPVAAAVGVPERILDAINQAYDRLSREAEQVMDSIEAGDLDTVAQELGEPQDLLDASDEAPIIRLVNSLMSQAIKERASDIHIEAFEKELSVRFRVDGVLYEVIKPPKRFQNSVISRIKIMAGLNIAEKRLPQDGRIRIKIAGKDIDIRTSVIPTSHGERVVMRLLDKSAVLLDLAELGFDDAKLRVMDELIQRPHGIILVTGPTGSGKTTTLYAALQKLNNPDINILTVEDPVEYEIKGIGQMQINPKIGLSFATGLRHFLRQDPDVLLVGEIRDFETAETAIQASLTGHLVFSTLHTNDAATAITRLIDMKVEPFLVASSVIAIMAQRLIRSVCPYCRQPYAPTDADLAEIGLDRRDIVEGRYIYRKAGCERCLKTGYLGRSGIFEMLIVDDEIRQLVLKNADSNTIKKTAIAKGMQTLRDDGAKKVALGITTIEEVLRVTQEDTF